MNVDEVRKLSQERSERVCREAYLHGSGQKETMAVAPILDDYQSLYGRDVVILLEDAAASASPGDQRRQAQYLLADCLETYLLHEVADTLDKASTEEATKKVEIAGQEIPYRQVSILSSNEADRDKRQALQTAGTQVVVELNTLLQDALEDVRRVITTDLRYPGYVPFYQAHRGIDLVVLDALMTDFLGRTDGLFRRVMTDWTASALDLPPDQCERHDINFLMRAREFDGPFSETRLMPTLEATIADLGVTLDRITLDLDKRATKSPRAFCSPVRVPDEIYLVVSTKGGTDDYQALLHECGHSLHFANTDSALPYEFRYLGDNSVTETFAFTIEHLMLNPQWLRAHIGLGSDEISQYRRHAYRNLLFMLRRYAAKLRWELQLHDERPLAGKDSVYSKTLEDALLIKYHREYWLVDTDLGFYSAQYLRAWILAAQFRAYLNGKFGPRWFQSAEAGRALGDLWRLGQRLPAQELAVLIGYEGLDIDPLVNELESVLGDRVVS